MSGVIGTYINLQVAFPTRQITPQMDNLAATCLDNRKISSSGHVHTTSVDKATRLSAMNRGSNEGYRKFVPEFVPWFAEVEMASLAGVSDV